MAVVQMVEGDEFALLQLTGVAAGNRLFAITAHWDVANHGILAGLSDSSGDAWTEVGQSEDSGAGAVQLWTCASATAGTHTITATLGTEFYVAVLFEVTGTYALDAIVANASNSLPLTTGATGALDGPNSFLIAAANICDPDSNDSMDIATPADWITLSNHQMGNIGGPGLASCYRTYAGTASQACDWGALARGNQFFSALIAAFTFTPPTASGVVGKTRPFGAGPFGLASFGIWTRVEAAGNAQASGAAIGSAQVVWALSGVAPGQSVVAGAALNPKALAGALRGLSDAAGGIVRDLVFGAAALALSDARGSATAVRGAFGQVQGQSYLQGRLRELWDRPDDIPTPPDWQPADMGASGPWNPITMPAPPSWVPQQPAEQ